MADKNYAGPAGVIEEQKYGYDSSSDDDVERPTKASKAVPPRSLRAVAASSSAPNNFGSATSKAASALIIAASDKAGMSGIDRERINAILLRESGNSAFMQRQRKMDDSTNLKIEEMKQRIRTKDDTATNDWRRESEQYTIEPLLQNFRRQRQPTSTCVVLDMDGFFISETLELVPLGIRRQSRVLVKYFRLPPSFAAAIFCSGVLTPVSAFSFHLLQRSWRQRLSHFA